VDKGAIKVVVFDLFDTLVKWEPERLPLLHWRERSTHSTLPWILPSLKERMGPRFELETFLTVYHEVIDEINAEREREGIEITCQERFERTLERLGYSDPAERSLLAFHVTRVHMDGVRKVTFAPPERSDAVRRLAPRFRLGLLSNFDDSQTGREIVHDSGVGHLFEVILISSVEGVSKPEAEIFLRAARRGHDVARPEDELHRALELRRGVHPARIAVTGIQIGVQHSRREPREPRQGVTVHPHAGIRVGRKRHLRRMPPDRLHVV